MPIEALEVLLVAVEKGLDGLLSETNRGRREGDGQSERACA